MNISKAEVRDLSTILSLQKLAYLSEAELVGDYSIPPLVQTLDGITDDFNKGIFLKAVENDEIIGSVRVRFADNTLHIGRLIVSPSHQNKGVGTKLLASAEQLYPNARYELFTSDMSAKNLSLYIKNGYVEFKREPLNKNVNLVFLEKRAEKRDDEVKKMTTSHYTP
jgi:GNAT superfamily N-acetyltransferase